MEGGTYIYLKVTGVDQTASNNHITVGPYECIIPEKGVNKELVTCQTTKPWDYNRLENLPVSV